MIVLYLYGLSFNEFMNIGNAVMEALMAVKNPNKTRVHLYLLVSDDFSTEFVAGGSETCELTPLCRIKNYTRGGEEFCHKIEKVLSGRGVGFIP
jgi:hypothetical protein